MCWQCNAQPHTWLGMFDSFVPLGWGRVPQGEGWTFVFEFEGEAWRTNPAVPSDMFHEALPGDTTADGELLYLPGFPPGNVPLRPNF